MARYNVRMNLDLKANFNLEVPQDAIKAGNIDSYIKGQLNDIISKHGVQGLYVYLDNYNLTEVNTATEDYTRIKSDSDDLENDLMEFDLF